MALPEVHARQTIDQLLGAAGWQVCDHQDAHITAHRGGANGPDNEGRLEDTARGLETDEGLSRRGSTGWTPEHFQRGNSAHR